MDYTDILLERDGHVAILTLNCPTKLNAISIHMKQELENAVNCLEQDDTIWGVILTGSGKAFSTGTDIAEFPSEVERARKITAWSQRILNRIENLNKPVIAAINGYALGGGLELALVSDLRVMSDAAKLGFPEVKICAIPCYGGTQRLTRLIGAGRAKEIIYTGRMVPAQQALEIGLVNAVCPPDTLMQTARALLDVILANAPMAVAYAKQCINRGAESSLDYALELEQQLVSMLVPTHDLLEGSRAFLEKRPPHFLNQ